MSGIPESLNQVSGAAVAAVLNSLLQATVLAVAAWVAMRFTPRMNAATRHVVWWAVLAAIVVLTVAPVMLGMRQGMAQPGAQFVARALPPANRATMEIEPSPAQMVWQETTVTARTAPRHSKGSAALLELRAGQWPTWIVAVWAAVFLLQLGRIAWSFAYLCQVKRRAKPVSPELRRTFDAWMMSCGVHRPARLLMSSEIVSPMAVGFQHPAVILPAPLLQQFQEPELDHVLLHELAHIARRDDWSNLFARLASALLALHPVGAWVLRQIEREREIACDDWVVSMIGAARPYAASLARLFEVCFVRRRMLLASGMAGRPSNLGERIEMLLHRSREFTPKASMMRVALSTAVLLAFAIGGAHAPRWFAFAQTATPPALFQDSMSPVAANAPNAARRESAPSPGTRRVQASTPRPGVGPADVLTIVNRAIARARPSGSFLAALVDAGYGNLSVDEIIDMKTAGVTPQFLNGINQAGWGKLSPREIIELSHRGVNPEYLRRVKEAGIRDLTLQDAMELAMHGVRPETFQEIHALGFGPYTAKETIRFAQSGVQPELFRDLKDAGLGNATPGEIVEAHAAGLGARNLREARQYGPNLTLKQIIKLKRAGVI